MQGIKRNYKLPSTIRTCDPRLDEFIVGLIPNDSNKLQRVNGAMS